MAKKDIPVEVVETEAEVVDVEVVETPEVEEVNTERSVEEAVTEDATTGEDGNEPAKKGAAKYPKSPKGEGVDPLTAGPALPNPDAK